MVGGQNQRFVFFIVGIAARVLASILFAGAALEALLALFGMTVADKVGTAVVQTDQRLSKHESIVPDQTHLSRYPIVMYPRSAVRRPNKKRVVPFHGQVINRVAAKTTARRTRCQLVGLVLLPRQIGDLQSGSRPADNTRPDTHRVSFHPTLTLHIQRMLRRARQRFGFARSGIMQRHVYHRRRMALNCKRHGLRFIFARRPCLLQAQAV